LYRGVPSYSRKPVSDRFHHVLHEGAHRGRQTFGRRVTGVNFVRRHRSVGKHDFEASVAQLPLASAALDVYRLAEKHGLLQRDLAALFELYPVAPQ
jgi:hypothetical protein